MIQQAMYRIDNPCFSASRSRAGADVLAADLCNMVEHGDANPQLIADVLRQKSGEAVESARKFIEWASPAHKRNNGWAIAAMSSARGYLIAARAVERLQYARTLAEALK